MKVRVLLPVLTLSAALLAGPAAAEAAKCDFARIAELPVTMNGYVPVVSVRINGQPAQLTLDTGAFHSVLSPEAAERLGVRKLTTGDLRIRGATGEGWAEVGQADSFQFAGYDMGRTQFVLAGHGTGARNAGVLGQNILGGEDVEYDLAGGMVRLFKAQNCRDADLAYWTDKPAGAIPIEPTINNRATIVGKAKVNGQTVRVLFDTGAARSMLSLDASRRLGVKLNASEVHAGGLSAGITGKLAESWIAPFDSFSLGEEEVRNVRLPIGDINLPGVDLLLGADFFLSHRILVAHSQNRLYFTYNGGPVFRADADAAPKLSGEAAEGAGAALDAGGYDRRAMASMTRRDYGAAIADFDRAIALQPSNPRHYVGRAQARLMSNDQAGALADFDHALTLAPSILAALFGRAEVELAQGQDAKAKADFDRATAAEGADEGLPLRIAAAYEQAGRFEQAVASYGAWIAGHAKDALLPRILIDRCRARGLWGHELNEALTDCEAGMKRGERNSQALDASGLVKLRLGRFDHALADYDAALRLQPKLAWALYGRGLAKQGRGKPEDGAADIDAALALNPKLAEVARRAGLRDARAGAR
ncbi:MAG: aspartyl protease family protein [Proteobacteria bacterium]|nr:aspartyl protease family protein [Pseudomonadota bacterium]